MKKLIAILILCSCQAFAASDEIEISIQNIFVPSVGFDGNDEVEVTVDGIIPNYCLTIGRTEVFFDSNRKYFIIKQYAVPRMITQCGEKKSEGFQDYLSVPYAFSRTLVVGRHLPEGLYTVQHKIEGQVLHERQFQVAVASSDSIDNMPYAPVTNVFIPELIEETSNAEIILTGIFNTSCVDVGETVVQRLGDVIVILPKLKVLSEQNCVHKKRPLQKIVGMGELKEGRYLIHVRSQSGFAVNRVFSVVKRASDHRGIRARSSVKF